MRVLSVVALLCVASYAAAITVTSTEFDVKRVIPGNTMQGITFTPNGDLYMSYGNQFCKYPGASNLPIGGTLSAANATCGTGASSTNIVSSQTGRIYNVHGFEINPVTWAGTRRWLDCGASHGIAVDPRDGAIFVSSVNTGKVWRIPNPDLSTGVYQTNCATNLYFDAGAAGLGGFDAITIAPDGTFYGAGYTANKLIILSPWSASNPFATVIAAKPTVKTSPDGLSICVSNGNSFALVAMTGNTISKFNLTGPGGAPTYAETTIASSVGGYLDFTAVDPKGCIWGTTLFGGAQGVYRVTNADGSCGCASAQVPQTGGCPNCNNVHTVTYAGSQDIVDSFVSTSGCVSLTFA